MLSTCTKCQQPLHFESFGKHGAWYIHSNTKRFFCSRPKPHDDSEPLLCVRHAYLTASYGTCAPLHTPLPTTAFRYTVAARERKLAEIDGLLMLARRAKLFGETRSAERCEASARALETYL